MPWKSNWYDGLMISVAEWRFTLHWKAIKHSEVGPSRCLKTTIQSSCLELQPVHIFRFHSCSFHRAVCGNDCFLCAWYAFYLVFRISRYPFNKQQCNYNLAPILNQLHRTKAFYFSFSALFRTQGKNRGKGSRISGFLSQVYCKITCLLGEIIVILCPFPFFFFLIELY